jgi:ComF family protein
MAASLLSRVLPTYCEQDLEAAAANGWSTDDASAYCRRCGASCGFGASTARGCAFCVGKPVPWNRVVRLGVYKPPVSDWILAMKFHKSWLWGRWFGERLAERIGDVPDTRRVVVCPVPMYFLRRWKRGYNQAELIAGSLAKARGWPLARLLRRRKYSSPQTSVPVSDRLANIRATFAPRRIDLRGWDVWLVDDVKTTGSTAGACARLLKQMGAAHVNLAVAAVADPHGADFKIV